MNRKERRIAQAQDKQPAAIVIRGKSYTAQEANILAVKEYRLGNVSTAVEILGFIVAKIPGDANSHNNHGIILGEMKRYDEAVASFGKALVLNPALAEAYCNRGNILCELGRFDEALKDMDKALALNSDYPDAHNNRGHTLQKMKRYEEALASYDKAMALRPDAVAYNNCGAVLKELKRYDEALASCDRALALKPDLAEAHHNRGETLSALKRHEEALVNYSKAMALKPSIPYLPGILLHTQMQLCYWPGIDRMFEALANGIEAGRLVSPPFAIVATPLSPAQQQKCAELMIKSKHPPSAARLWNGETYSHEKMRIGYFSSDFRARRPLPHLMAQFFESHDHAKFETIAFSIGPSAADPVRKRLEKAFDRFIDVSDKSEREIATLARQMEIDIAIDLTGLTLDSKTGIFALRPAPVQVSYMGYPGTMGASYIDYLIADETVIPEEHKRYYSEKIVHLPHSYWVIDRTAKISDKTFTRHEVGLPEDGFVFCCFNNNYKITPDVFSVWMRLLQKVPGSVLWLFEGSPAAAKNLRAEAESRGVAGNRLIYGGYTDVPEHLARHRLADLFLDTFHCNAHTTASDALWAGLPVLTCLGETFASRVAASLLKASDLPQLITHSHAEYEALAFELATDRQKLSNIRQALAQNRTSCPLFNTSLFTRHMEQAYSKMFERAKAGAPPGPISIETLA